MTVKTLSGAPIAPLGAFVNIFSYVIILCYIIDIERFVSALVYIPNGLEGRAVPEHNFLFLFLFDPEAFKTQ